MVISGRILLERSSAPKVLATLTMTHSGDADGHHMPPSVGTLPQVTVVETRHSKDKGLPRSPSALGAQQATTQPVAETSVPEDDHPLTVTMSFL